MSDSLETENLAATAERENRQDPTEQMVLAYRGWDEYERCHGGPAIVDFDMASLGGSASFNSRREVLSALLEIHDNLNGPTEEHEFLRTRLRGSVAYLRALMGQQIPFAEYLKLTLGIEPAPFHKEELESARKEASTFLSTFGFEMRAQDREKYESSMLIRDPAMIRKGIVENRHLWLKRLLAAGIPVPREIPLSVQFTEVDAYWSNWINGSAQKGITLSINLHTRKKYDKGRPLNLCLHEVCGHAVQMVIWRDLIAEGKMNQACGLTTVHSPEMFVSEGLGQTVSDLLGEGWLFPPEFLLSRALQYYTLLVLHNAHLMIYERVSVETILDYAVDRLPLLDPETIEHEIRDRGNDPLFRSYQLSYAIGERTIRNMSAGFNSAQKRKFFNEIYTRPMTPQQLFLFGQRLNG